MTDDVRAENRRLRAENRRLEKALGDIFHAALEVAASCVDYGHHGREKCVVCGTPNPAHIDGAES